MPGSLLEFAQLSADRLQRHAQSLGGAGEAALLGDHAEVVQVAVVHQDGMPIE